MKTDVKIIRGTTNTFNITVTDASGNLYSLASGEKLLFGVKKKHTDEEYLILKTVTDGTNGVYTVTINPDDTEDLDCNRYFYDVGIQSGTAFYNVIEASVFEVCKNITKRGAS